jgi:hypothetical protein
MGSRGTKVDVCVYISSRCCFVVVCVCFVSIDRSIASERARSRSWREYVMIYAYSHVSLVFLYVTGFERDIGR